jgi:hypothetical protein
MGRLRDGDVIAGAGGLALIASLFLDWYGLGARGLGASGWEAFSVLDVVLALLALVPLGLVVTQATRDSPSIPVAFSVFAAVAGIVATLLILYRVINQPGPNDLVTVELGAWIGLAASVAAAAGGWRSMRVEAMPGRPVPPVEDLPAPAP